MRTFLVWVGLFLAPLCAWAAMNVFGWLLHDNSLVMLLAAFAGLGLPLWAAWRLGERISHPRKS